MDKKSNLKLVKQVFEKEGVNFFVVYGVCLGFYRDKDFLPGDDDIDLAVMEPISLEKRKKIGWLLYDLGFKPQAIMFNVFGRMEPGEPGYNGDGETGIIVCEKDVKFTIFFFKKEQCDIHGEEYVCVPKLGAVKLISTPTRFYKKHGEIKISEEKYRVPFPTDKYLEFSYKDWKNKLARDHSPTYNEAHAGNMMREVIKTNEAIKWQ